MHGIWIVSAAALLALAGCAHAPSDRASKGAFDAPLKTETVSLPKDPLNPQMSPHITCSRYPGFMVKEIDLGEKGAAKLAISPKDALCEADAPNEVLISNRIEGYFRGVKGAYIFFDAPDSWDGGLRFFVFGPDGKNQLFEDAALNGDFQAIELRGRVLVLRFERVFHADCSLYLDQNICAQTIEAATSLGGEGASPGLALPDCTKAYEAALKKTAPEYIDSLKSSASVIRYPVELTFDGASVFIAPMGGKPATCHVPS